MGLEWMFVDMPKRLSVEFEMALREHIKEVMTSGEAGLMVTLLGEPRTTTDVEELSGRERRRRHLPGVLAEVLGGTAGARAGS